MGTQLMALELKPADFGGERYAGCYEALVLSRPEAIGAIHRFLPRIADGEHRACADWETPRSEYAVGGR